MGAALTVSGPRSTEGDSDTLGSYRDQPATSEILIDDTHALMTQAARARLMACDSSLPSGIYVGKVWRRREWLCRDGAPPTRT